MTFPTTPPAGTPARRWAFPATVRRVLSWGLHVVAVRMPALPIVHVRWSFRAGRAIEPAHRMGAGRLLAAVARHGTEHYDSAALAEHVDHLGARLCISVSLDNTVVSVTALSEHLDAAIDLAEEVTYRPSFPEREIDRERAKAIELHRHARTEPDSLAGTWLGWLMYGLHPYGRPPTSEAGLRATHRDDLMRLHHRLVDPSAGLLLVVGDVDAEALVERLALRYDALRSRAGARAPAVSQAPTRSHRRIVVVDRPASEQAVIAAGHLVMPRRHPDYLPLRVVNQVLGAGAASRLFMELRERRSLTYGVYSTLDTGRLGGDLTVGLACGLPKVRQAVDSMLEELERIARDPVPADELDRARKYLVGSFPRMASGVGGVASLVNTAWLNDLPDDVWSTYQAAIAAVDVEEAHRVATTWIHPDDTAMVVVGPADEVASPLEELGPVELRTMSDADFEQAAGNPVRDDS